MYTLFNLIANVDSGMKWTWNKQPLNDRLLRPPTFVELYHNEMFLFGSYFIFILLFMILSYYASKKIKI